MIQPILTAIQDGKVDQVFAQRFVEPDMIKQTVEFAMIEIKGLGLVGGLLHDIGKLCR